MEKKEEKDGILHFIKSGITIKIAWIYYKIERANKNKKAAHQATSIQAIINGRKFYVV